MRTGLETERKLTKQVLHAIAPILAQRYVERFAQNYHAFYAYSPGSSHSKILVLVYPEFLRVVITSCNMMDIDTIGGDNHWYIHDMPKLSSQTNSASKFETELLAHLEALSTPSAFIDSIRGWYDYTEVGVHLVTSVPGVQAGENAEKHGLLRLRRVLLDLDLGLPEKNSEDLRLEVCTASLGNLSAKWLNGFNDCALGKSSMTVADDDSTVPDVKLFYPSVTDVKEKANIDAQMAASNIGCHIRPWEKASAGIKNIFHHYESKDTGRLFHQKFILAYNPRNSTALPYYVYIVRNLFLWRAHQDPLF